MFHLDTFVAPIIAFAQAQQGLAPFLAFALAFGESLALVSIFIPATVLLLGFGAVIEAGGLDFWSIWVAAALGAAMGDTVSYWLGFHFKDGAKTLWPLSRRPDLVARAEDFFVRYGVWSVAVGRFFGPVRAVVPLVAGVLAMRQVPFQLANVTSAFAWAFLMLAPGAAALKFFGQ